MKMNKNKNNQHCMKSGSYNSVKQFRFGLVITIWSNLGQNVLSDIVCMCRHFHECVLLYKLGHVKIYLNQSPSITALLSDSNEKNDKRLKLENIGTWSKYFDTFLVLVQSNREHIVLIKEPKTQHIFDMYEDDFSRSVVSIKLEDLLLNQNSCKIFDEEFHARKLQIKHLKISGQTKNETFCGKVSLKRTRKIVLSSYNTVKTWIASPQNGEIPMNENFPQQVSDEQNVDGRSSFLFSNGLSLPVTTDHSRSAIDIDGRNLTSDLQHYTVSGEASSFVHNAELTGTGNSSYSAHGARYPNYIQFHERLKSFARWIHSSPDPNTLSKAGFFFTNDSDLVRCFQCGIGLKDFSHEDDPLKEHIRHSGNCLFLVETIGEDRLAEWKRLLQSQDPEYNRRMQWENRDNMPTGAYDYRHPEYQTREKRLETFVNWPAQMLQRPEQLADAGLYYTGFEDHVRCFACDGGLRRWDPHDDPWTEHCRWFPACPFARETKGDDFIALIQASVNLENEGEAREPRGEDLSEDMEQMTIRDPEIRAALDEHKDACLAMGFETTQFNEAVQEIRDRGTIKPSIEEIVDVIEVIQARKLQDSSKETRQNETPLEENQRLKRNVICMKCEQNDVNTLFLPCTHHRLCMKCADQETSCPVCGKYIRQKIRTFMV